MKEHKEIYPTNTANLNTEFRVQRVDSESAGNLSLLLSELNKEDEGLYRCEIGNDIYKDVHLNLTGK